MGMIKSLILLTVFMINNVAAEEVIHLEKDQPAPYDGFLFDSKTAEPKLRAKFKTLERDNTLLKKIAENNKEQSKIAIQRAELHRQQNQNLSYELQREKDKKGITKIIYFTLGILATGAATYGASKILNK